MSDGIPEAVPAHPPEPHPPREPLTRLFLRFLRFGALAWGGPVAQIAMIQKELVDDERWVSRERFNRTLAIYQALPGPEAHELCCWFGMLSRGRAGAVLAGLGFMAPGLVLMLAISWIYVAVGLDQPWLRAAFAGCQAAIVAVVLRAVHRIAKHAITDGWLAAIALVAFATQLAGLHFGVTLAAAGLAAALRSKPILATATLVALVVAAGAVRSGSMEPTTPAPEVQQPRDPTVPHVFATGLKAGLLTFGGAYTAIPIVERDAVERSGWLTRSQFLDGLALSGVLPAPFIIFTTFVGYIAGGLVTALVMTAGVFLPAFAFTLVGHDVLERLVMRPGMQRVLDGVTAGVCGIIAATSLALLREGVTDVVAAAIFLAALAAVYLWRWRGAVAVIVIGAGVLAWAATLVSATAPG